MSDTPGPIDETTDPVADDAPSATTLAATTDVADTAETAPPAPGRRRWATVVLVILGVLAVVGLLASTLAVWAKRTLSDSEKFAAVAEKVLEDPDVTDALATRITTEVFTALELEARLTELLPSQLDPLAGTIVNAAQAAIDNQLSQLLAREGTRQLIGEVVERAHGRVVDVIRGDALPDVINVNDDQVTLNMLPLYGQAITAIQDRFGILSGVELPELEPDGDPAEQISELEEAFGRDLPDDFGQITIYEGEAVANAGATVELARDAVATANQFLWVLLAVTVLLYAAVILIARNKKRALLWLGLASAAALLLSRVIISNILEQIPQAVAATGARATVNTAIRELVSGLRFSTGVLIVVSLGVAGVSWWLLRKERREAAVGEATAVEA
jgi:hypothetical protein